MSWIFFINPHMPLTSLTQNWISHTKTHKQKRAWAHPHSFTHSHTHQIICITGQAMYIQRNTEACSRNHHYNGRAVNITHSIASVNQQSSVACLPLPYCSTLSHKWEDFLKNFLNIKLVFWFSLQLLSDTFLILRRIQWDIINVHTSSCKVPVVLVIF